MIAETGVNATTDVKTLIAIDPGTTHSAYVVCRLNDQGKIEKILETVAQLPNEEMCNMFDVFTRPGDQFVIEMISSYGQRVGREVFETCLWIGRFIENILLVSEKEPDLITRHDVKMRLTGKVAGVNDSALRQVVMDLHGGKVAKGTKKNPGPLYNVKADAWQALAIAHAWCVKP